MRNPATFLFFLFFISCKVEPYRELEIVIPPPADAVSINLHTLPDSTLILARDWERNYESSIRLSHLEDGQYYLKARSLKADIDTSFVFTQRLTLVLAW